MAKFRARQQNEDMGAYLAAKQAYESKQTGTSGVDLGTTKTPEEIMAEARATSEKASAILAGQKPTTYKEGDIRTGTTGVKEVLRPWGEWTPVTPEYEKAQPTATTVVPTIPVTPTTPVTPVTDVADTTPIDVVAPDLPPAVDYTAYFSGIAAEVANTRTSLEKMYQDQIDLLKSQQETAQKKVDDMMAKQKDVLETDIQPLLQPWREDLEKAERARLKVEENYFANQNSVKELEDLLNQSLSDIQAAESVTGLSSIRSPRIAKVKEDYAARAGVIEAVMAARNNQITVANNFIDRSANAIASDKNAQLSYYESLYNFYETQRTEEGAKLISLSEDEKDYVNAQIGLLENDLAQAQSTTNYIKQLMLDPATASAMDGAGVTLNDTPQQIQAKLAAYSYQQEVIDKSNAMTADGFKQILESQVATKPANEVIVITDSKGVMRYYWKEAEAETGWATGTPTSYKEWQLAGSPGTYEEFLAMGEGIEGLSVSQKELLAGLVQQIPTYPSKEEALSDAENNQASISIQAGQSGYNKLIEEINKYPFQPAEVPTEGSGIFGGIKSFFSNLFNF